MTRTGNVALLTILVFLLLSAGNSHSFSQSPEGQTQRRTPVLDLVVGQNEENTPAAFSRNTDKLVLRGVDMENFNNVFTRNPKALRDSIMFVDNDESTLVPVNIQLGLLTSFVFPFDEEIASYSIGNNKVFETVFKLDGNGRPIEPNIFRIRARQINDYTNLTFITKSKTMHHFLLRAIDRTATGDLVPTTVVNISVNKQVEDYVGKTSAVHPEQETIASLREDKRERILSRISAMTEDDSGAQNPESVSASFTRGKKMPDWIRDIKFDPRNVRFDEFRYFVQDKQRDMEIMPEEVFHDGIYTFLYYGDKVDYIEVPSVRMVLDGIDTPVNWHVTGPKFNILVIEAIGDFTLRAGKKIVCLRYIGNLLYDNTIPASEIELLGTGRSRQAKNSPVTNNPGNSGNIKRQIREVQRLPEGDRGP